jgi:cobalt-precorrin 5A hydrolase
MRTAVIALTAAGTELALRVRESLESDIYVKPEWVPQTAKFTFHAIEESLTDCVGKIFNQYDALIFIMAAGIVVRVIDQYLIGAYRRGQSIGAKPRFNNGRNTGDYNRH